MALIGLLSDVHASPGPVEEALSIFSGTGVDEIFCVGDIAGYYDQCKQTVALLESSGCQTVIGNHDQKYLEKHALETENHSVLYFQQLPLPPEW